MIDSIATDFAPVFGTVSYSRIRDSGIGRLPPMRGKDNKARSRDVLRANVNTLMKSERFRDSFGTPRQLIEAGKGVTNGTLARIRNAETGASVDTLDALAETFGIEPWQLLIPNIRADTMPTLASPALLSEIRSLVLRESPKTEPEQADGNPTVPLPESGKTDVPARQPGAERRTVRLGSKRNVEGRKHGKGSTPGNDRRR